MKALIDIVKTRGPISRAELAKRLNISEREVRGIIHDLNVAKVPIVFTGRGFVYTAKRAEAEACAEKLMSAGRSLIRRAAGLKKADVEKVVREMFA